MSICMFSFDANAQEVASGTYGVNVTWYTATYGEYVDTKDIQDITIDSANHTWNTNIITKKPTAASEGDIKMQIYSFFAFR